MSTSRSDRDDKTADKTENESEAARPRPRDVGVAGLFKRAVASHAERGQATPNAIVAAGVGLTTCSHCGAPRLLQALVCFYCEGKL